MDDIYQQLRNITLTGRLCYLFMCIEKYLTVLYPHQDWTPVAKKMWQCISQEYWEDAEDIYDEIVPEYILQFDTYEETNLRAYDGKLKKEDYDKMISCFEGITQGNSADEICQVLMIPSKFYNICMYSSFSYIEPEISKIFTYMKNFLYQHDISLPDISLVKDFNFDINNSNEREKWGKNISAEYLSIILNSDLSPELHH